MKTVGTPLRPDIRYDDRLGKALTVCNCCGSEDRVRMIRFGWMTDLSFGMSQGGGTSVALCRSCRTITHDLTAPDEESKP